MKNNYYINLKFNLKKLIKIKTKNAHKIILIIIKNTIISNLIKLKKGNNFHW